jgi:hypothetical protein
LKVTLVQSGGFAGLRVGKIADTEALPTGDAKQLKDLVEAAGFFDLAERIGFPPKHADRFHYRIGVEDGSRQKTVLVSEEALSDQLKALVHWLQASGTDA